MTVLAEPAEPLMGEVPICRVRKGEETPEPLWVVYNPPFGCLPASLLIGTRWDGSQFHQWDRYTVEAVSKTGNVTTVRLKRDEDKLLTLPLGSDRTPFYEVSVIGETGFCTCRGWSLQGDGPRRNCKHIAGVAFVAGSGEFLSERQVGDESGAIPGGGQGGPQGAGGGGRADRGVEDPVREGVGGVA